MATSGTVKTNTEYDSYFWVSWSQSSQNVNENKTTISWSCGVYAGHSFYSNAIRMSAVSINGTQVYAGGTYSNIAKSNYTLASGTLSITHNSDGNKSFSVSSFTGWLYSNHNYSSSGGSWDLPQIPRASSISCADTYIGDNATISISKASSSFTTTIAYSFSGLTGTIVSQTSNTSVSWTVPTSFYAKIPNNKNGVVTLTATTYNGSTAVGSKTASFYAVCKQSICEPVFSSGYPKAIDSNATTVALTGSNTKFIKYYSNATIEFGLSARNSATLTSKKVVCGSKSLTADGTISAVGSASFVFTGADSRGFPVSKTFNYTLIDYIPLTLVMSATNPNASGVFTLTTSGNFWNSSFSGASAGNNSLTLRYRIKASGGSYGSYTSITNTKANSKYSSSSSITIPNFDYTKSYVVQVSASDRLVSGLSVTQTIQAKPIFDWSASDFSFNVPINSKENIYMGGLNGQTGEQSLRFSNPTNSTYPHNSAVYGGNPSSKTDIGIWDTLNSRGVFRYESSANNNYGAFFIPITSIISEFEYNSNSDSNESALNNWLNVRLNSMPDSSLMPCKVCAYPAISGTSYSGFLFKHSSGYAHLYGKDYFGETIYKPLQNGTWSNTTRYSYSSINSRLTNLEARHGNEFSSISTNDLPNKPSGWSGYGRALRWGAPSSADKYYLLIDSNGKLFTGVSANNTSATANITWREK